MLYNEGKNKMIWMIYKETFQKGKPGQLKANI